MKRTPLFKFHEKHGRLGEFSGFMMPIWYKGTIKEHMSVRNNVGVFDVSHMGRLLITGAQSADFLDFLSTKNCSDLTQGKSQIALFCNESGGIIDDVMVTSLGKDSFLVTVNAMNKDSDLNWIARKRGEFDFRIIDLTQKVPMIAVQGPRSVETLERILGRGISSIAKMHSSWSSLDGKRLLISRTGYTGEDGFEVCLFENGDESEALAFWQRVLDAGEELSIEPCGLAARDTLRLEAGFCLYGNELSKDVKPIEARLQSAVEFDGRRFVGRDALFSQSRKGADRLRAGLTVLERGIPRKGMKIWRENEEIGFTTSGNLSPTLNKGIAMGHVLPEYASIGTEVSIEIRGRKVKAEVVGLPFYRKGEKL